MTEVEEAAIPALFAIAAKTSGLPRYCQYVVYARGFSPSKTIAAAVHF